MESRSRHLDTDGGRTVVYCHQCQNEWYQDEHGVRQCPYCQSDIVEVVTPGADDPRMPIEDDDDNGVRQFDRTPHPYHLHSRNHHLENADDNTFDSDPEEGDIEEHIQTGPGVFVRTRFYSSGPRRNGPGNNGRRAPADPNDPASVINRFQEMLMNDFSVGIPGRSGPDTLFPGDRDSPFGNPSGTFQHRTTFISNSGPGGSSMAFTLGGSPAPPPPQAPQFEQYANPTPSRRPPNRVILVSFSSETNGEPTRLFGSIMGNARPPNRAGSSQSPTREGAPNPANPGGFLAQSLADILSVLMPLAGGGINGDIVYSQEAMDRILTQLMEQNPLSNAPPPASDTALEKLTRKKLDAEMLGPDGKGECTICIDEMKLDEQATVLPCKHWFHEDCVVSWLKEHNTCPICRHSVETEKETRAAEAEPARASGTGPSVQASSSFSNTRDQPATPNLNDWPALGGGRPTRLGRTEEERRARLESIRASAGLGPAPLSTFSPSNHTPRRRHSRSPDSSSRRSSTYGGLDRDRDMERDRERDERNRGERDIRQSRLNYFTSLGRGGPNGGNEGSGSSHGQGSRRQGSGNNSNGSGSENSDSQGSQGISGWIRSAFHQGRRS